jgi:hypothetical protein
VLGAGSQTLSVTFTPTDTAHYSNATATRTIRVLYAGAGTLCLGVPGHQVLAPVTADGSSVFKGGSSIAVQFRVCNVSGASIGTPGVITSFALGSTAMANGFNWDPKIRAWTMVLSTKTLATGPTYTGTIGLNDGTSITFTFTLR